MTVTDLERMYDYGYWANRRLLSVAARLTPEQFTQHVAGTYGSVRTTLVHIMAAEWAWLERSGGQARSRRIVADDYPTVAAVVDAWAALERYVRAFLASWTDDDLAGGVACTGPGGSTRVMAIGTMLQHGANHGVHHRGQVSMLLRMLGAEPVDIDLLFYDVERHNLEPW